MGSHPPPRLRTLPATLAAACARTLFVVAVAVAIALVASYLVGLLPR